MTIHALVQASISNTSSMNKFVVGSKVPFADTVPSVVITRIELTPGHESYDIYVNDGGVEKLQAVVPAQHYFAIYNL